MSIKEEELSSRLATGADFDDVMAIRRGLFGGLDYLCGMYHLWLHEPNTYMFVTEHRGKVIGFNVMRLVSPTMMFAKGARIHKDYQGLGLTEHVYSASKDWVLSNNPSIDTEIYTFYTTPKTFKFVNTFLKQWKTCQEWHIHVYDTDASHLKQTNLFENIPEVQVAINASHHATVQEVMRPNTLAQVDVILHKHGSLFCYGAHLARPITKVSIREAAQMCDVILTTEEGTQTEDIKNTSIRGLSFGSYVKCTQGIRVDLWMYPVQENLPMYLAHIKMHMSHVANVCRGKSLKVAVYLPKHFNADAIESSLDGSLGERVKNPPYGGKGSIGTAGTCLADRSRL